MICGGLRPIPATLETAVVATKSIDWPFLLAQQSRRHFNQPEFNENLARPSLLIAAVSPLLKC